MKIYITLLACLLIGGCEYTISKSNSVPFDQVTHFTYEGHDYIKFRGGYQGAVTHDPDCKCRK